MARFVTEEGKKAEKVGRGMWREEINIPDDAAIRVLNPEWIPPEELTIRGLAEAVGTDTVRVGETTVKLAGLTGARSELCEWDEGECENKAREALEDLVNANELACSPVELASTESEAQEALCTEAGEGEPSCDRRECWINWKMVRHGHASAQQVPIDAIRSWPCSRWAKKRQSDNKWAFGQAPCRWTPLEEPGMALPLHSGGDLERMRGKATVKNGNTLQIEGQDVLLQGAVAPVNAKWCNWRKIKDCARDAIEAAKAMAEGKTMECIWPQVAWYRNIVPRAYCFDAEEFDGGCTQFTCSMNWRMVRQGMGNVAGLPAVAEPGPDHALPRAGRGSREGGEERDVGRQDEPAEGTQALQVEVINRARQFLQGRVRRPDRRRCHHRPDPGRGLEHQDHWVRHPGDRADRPASSTWCKCSSRAGPSSGGTHQFRARASCRGRVGGVVPAGSQHFVRRQDDRAARRKASRLATGVRGARVVAPFRERTPAVSVRRLVVGMAGRGDRGRDGEGIVHRVQVAVVDLELQRAPPRLVDVARRRASVLVHTGGADLAQVRISGNGEAECAVGVDVQTLCGGRAGSEQQGGQKRGEGKEPVHYGDSWESGSDTPATAPSGMGEWMCRGLYTTRRKSCIGKESNSEMQDGSNLPNRCRERRRDHAGIPDPQLDHAAQADGKL